MPGLPLDKEEVTTAAERASGRFVGLLREVRRPDVAVCGRWSTGDVAAHISGVLDWMIGMAGGEPSPVKDHRKISAASDEVLANEPERDPIALADRLEDQTTRFFSNVRRREGDPEITWHGGIRLPVSVLSSLVLGEALIHGFDIAKFERIPWEISKEDAVLLNAGGTHVIPYFVNEPYVRGLRVSYEIRLRGGERFRLMFSEGRLDVVLPDERKPDCVISIDPVTWQLVGYGRINPILPGLTGKMMAFGRKPWLALKLTKAFDNP